uniref:Uncharacterized protein n=1 Tax=Cacopsylla melanoneura TaxID=428564 RepID=A0A8D8LBI7_9HEMI
MDDSELNFSYNSSPKLVTSDSEERVASHLILKNLGKARYKAKIERAHRDVAIRTQHIVRKVKEKHRGYVVKKYLCDIDPNNPEGVPNSASSSFTADEIEMYNVSNDFILNDMSEDTDASRSEYDSNIAFRTAGYDVSYYLDVAARELESTLTDSDILTNISSIELVSNASSDVLSEVSSIHKVQHGENAYGKSEYLRRTV